MVYGLIPIQKVPKLPKIPRVKPPQIPEIKDLEKAVELVERSYGEFFNIGNLARQGIGEIMDLEGTPRPFFWQINKIEALRAKSNRCYELARGVTEALKGMGILKENVGVLNPAYAMGLIADHQIKSLEKILETYPRLLNDYSDYHAKIVREIAVYNKIYNESMAENYKGIGSSYGAFGKKSKKNKNNEKMSYSEDI